MKNNATEHHRGWRRRAMSVLGALVIAGCAVAVTASAAAATMACNRPPEGGSHTCLTIERLNAAEGALPVGIDVEMSRQDAQVIINANGGVPFGTLIMAHAHDDPGDDPRACSQFPLPPAGRRPGKDLREGMCDQTSLGGCVGWPLCRSLTFEPEIHIETDRKGPNPPGKCLQNTNEWPVLVGNGNCCSREQRTADGTIKAFYSIR